MFLFLRFVPRGSSVLVRKPHAVAGEAGEYATLEVTPVDVAPLAPLADEENGFDQVPDDIAPLADEENGVDQVPDDIAPLADEEMGFDQVQDDIAPCAGEEIPSDPVAVEETHSKAKGSKRKMSTFLEVPEDFPADAWPVPGKPRGNISYTLHSTDGSGAAKLIGLAGPTWL